MHGIEAVKVDDMDSLKACSNWDQWWETTGGGTDLSSLVDGGEGSVEDVEVKKKKVVGSLVARRRMTEASQGWERGRRISLTCRRVAKVRKGIKLG